MCQALPCQFLSKVKILQRWIYEIVWTSELEQLRRRVQPGDLKVKTENVSKKNLEPLTLQVEDEITRHSTVTVNDFFRHVNCLQTAVCRSCRTSH